MSSPGSDTDAPDLTGGAALAADIDRVEKAVRTELDGKFAAREEALKTCRRIIQGSSKAIRALHRGESEVAAELIAEVRGMITAIEPRLAEHGDIYHAGFFHDAVKEYAESELTAALLGGKRLPMPDELGVAAVSYLHGLGDAVGEMRRHLLDQLRGDDLAGAQTTFASMEAVLDLFTGLDYPDGMTSGLRRITDVARSLVERSRSDLTLTVVQDRLRRHTGPA